uniref:Uncharacterized protein LOC102801715 n=1 Tax=Saccoglossus kowalevskii TaxID=10224 RepID=A0ABM0MDI2_SACKO|nr:PREDICTED: uncharacterized protein LOC102801715 [Saccoglossus kowalevskii]
MAFVYLCRDKKDVKEVKELQLYHIFKEHKSSFLIVINGDEESRNLTELVSKDWLTTWEYTDENTLCLAAKGRIFTILETFNDGQKTAILNYLDRVPFVSSLDGVRNVLVLGCTGDSDVTWYIEDNPLLKKCELDADHVCADINMFTSFDYDMKPGVRANEATITLFHECPIQVCERQDIERTISDDLLRLIQKTTNSRFRHVFDSVIINCHCSDCFNTVIDSLEDITIKIGKQHAGSIREHLARNINENQPWVILPSEDSQNPCFMCGKLSEHDAPVCVDMSLKCNGRNNCPDGSDEDYYLCYGDSCVANLHSHQLCDGIKHCMDGRDEKIDKCIGRENRIGLGMAVTLYFFTPLTIVMAILVLCVLCCGRCDRRRYTIEKDAITYSESNVLDDSRHTARPCRVVYDGNDGSYRPIAV